MANQPDDSKVIVIYDGYCGFCYRIVSFIERRDTSHRLDLLPRQSKEARSLLAGHHVSSEENESVIVLADGKALHYSDATMCIWQELGGIWSIISWLRFVPRTIRDWVYGIIARNRYHWFGKYETCQWPRNKRNADS